MNAGLWETAAIGGLLFLDCTAVGHFLISAPIITGPLIGWILGDINMGFIIGAYLELIWIGLLPVGSRIPPDANIVAIIATASLIIGGVGFEEEITPFVLVWGVIYGVCCGIVARELKVKVMSWRSTFAHWCDMAAREGRLWFIDLITLLSIVIDWLLMFVFYLIAVTIGQKLMAVLYSVDWMPFKVASHVAFDAFIFVGIAVVMDLFARKMESWFVFAGASAVTVAILLIWSDAAYIICALLVGAAMYATYKIIASMGRQAV